MTKTENSFHTAIQKAAAAQEAGRQVNRKHATTEQEFKDLTELSASWPLKWGQPKIGQMYTITYNEDIALLDESGTKIRVIGSLKCAGQDENKRIIMEYRRYDEVFRAFLDYDKVIKQTGAAPLRDIYHQSEGKRTAPTHMQVNNRTRK